MKRGESRRDEVPPPLSSGCGRMSTVLWTLPQFVLNRSLGCRPALTLEVLRLELTPLGQVWRWRLLSLLHKQYELLEFSLRNTAEQERG